MISLYFRSMFSFMVASFILFSTVDGTLITNCTTTKCVFKITSQSMNFFRSRLIEEEPKLVKFKIQFDDVKRYNSTPDTFEPLNWVWTYNSSRGMYPYLYWNVDFGLLSFGLLEAKTLREHIYVYMSVKPRNPSNPEECAITMGSRDTTEAIACAFQDFVDPDKKPFYPNSYFCYLAERPEVRDTVGYQLALYSLYPVEFINYNCCFTGYNYTAEESFSGCLKHQVKKWPQCTIVPFILGIFLLLYCPILIMRIGEGLSINIAVINQEYELIGEDYDNTTGNNSPNSDWVFLTDRTPYGITDALSHIWCGLDKTCPIFVSRIKRFLLVVLAPTPVFVQLCLYKFCWEPGLLQKLVHHGTPMGFLTMLGDSDDRIKYFVPALGGGLTILVSFGIIGLLLVVLPYNLKQVLEDGLPRGSNTISSPLCLGFCEITDLSMKQANSGPGYGSCADILVCGIYLLFSSDFWKRVFDIQKNRLKSVLHQHCHGRLAVCFLMALIAPLYIVLCFIEIVACFIWYGIPFLRFISFLIRGVYVSLLTLRVNSEGQRDHTLSFVSNPFVLVVISVILFAMSTFFTYTFCLIFIQGFVFMANVLMFCLVALIVYPAISLGYLYFFVVLLYYIFHLMRGFGDTYLMLLSEAVDISRNLDGEINHTIICGTTLQVSNIRAQNITKVRLENKLVSIPQNLFQTITAESNRQPKIRALNNTYGIPKKLFRKLVQKHHPPNQQVLKILFQLVLIIILLSITMSITAGFVTGPTSEISDVMHVIFIVVIGALPRVLEVAFSSSSESVKREIEMRHYEQTIVRYWQREEMHTFA